MSNYQNGFCRGYFTKQADASEAAVDAVGGVANTTKDIVSMILPYAIVAPAVFGVAAGTIQSKITSPSALDKKLIQKAMLSQNMDRQLSELRRRKALRQDQEEQASVIPAERSLHLG